MLLVLLVCCSPKISSTCLSSYTCIICSAAAATAPSAAHSDPPDNPEVVIPQDSAPGDEQAWCMASSQLFKNVSLDSIAQYRPAWTVLTAAVVTSVLSRLSSIAVAG